MINIKTRLKINIRWEMFELSNWWTQEINIGNYDTSFLNLIIYNYHNIRVRLYVKLIV